MRFSYIGVGFEDHWGRSSWSWHFRVECIWYRLSTPFTGIFLERLSYEFFSVYGLP